MSATSLLGLKAQVAKSQQEAADIKEGRVDISTLRDRSRGGTIAAVLERKNPGVGTRDERDRQDIKVSARVPSKQVKRYHIQI